MTLLKGYKNRWLFVWNEQMIAVGMLCWQHCPLHWAGRGLPGARYNRSTTCTWMIHLTHHGSDSAHESEHWTSSSSPVKNWNRMSNSDVGNKPKLTCLRFDLALNRIGRQVPTYKYQFGKRAPGASLVSLWYHIRYLISPSWNST